MCTSNETNTYDIVNLSLINILEFFGNKSSILKLLSINEKRKIFVIFLYFKLDNRPMN
jgi:hypothetical protein